jgi:hypothetical protein
VTGFVFGNTTIAARFTLGAVRRSITKSGKPYSYGQSENGASNLYHDANPY